MALFFAIIVRVSRNSDGFDYEAYFLGIGRGLVELVEVILVLSALQYVATNAVGYVRFIFYALQILISFYFAAWTTRYVTTRLDKVPFTAIDGAKRSRLPIIMLVRGIIFILGIAALVYLPLVTVNAVAEYGG